SPQTSRLRIADLEPQPQDQHADPASENADNDALRLAAVSVLTDHVADDWREDEENGQEDHGRGEEELKLNEDEQRQREANHLAEKERAPQVIASCGKAFRRGTPSSKHSE